MITRFATPRINSRAVSHLLIYFIWLLLSANAAVLCLYMTIHMKVCLIWVQTVAILINRTRQQIHKLDSCLYDSVETTNKMRSCNIIYYSTVF
jgi:hypothetical protein